MTIEEIRKFRNAEPFHPFRIHLSDGRQLLVRQPENIGWGGTGRRLVVYSAPDYANVVDREMVVKVEAAKSSRKGRPSPNSRKGLR